MIGSTTINELSYCATRNMHGDRFVGRQTMMNSFKVILKQLRLLWNRYQQ